MCEGITLNILYNVTVMNAFFCQVDAALGAEEMVENLTTKCLDLEDRVAALIEEKMDLEVK